MGTWKKYFRQHPWQRRVVRLLVVVIVGCVVGRLTYPGYLWYQRRQGDLRLIGQLGSPEPRQREVAIQTAILLGQRRNELIERLADALDTPSDNRFLALRFVLRRLGAFDTPDRDPQWYDRYRLLEFRATFAPDENADSPYDQPPFLATARMRRWLVRQAVLCERNNTYLHQTAQAAANDPAEIVRQAAAPLSARLGDDDTLAKLLNDSAIGVRATAALDAGIAGRTALAGRIRQRFEAHLKPTGPPNPAALDQIACEAYALATLDPAGNSDLLRQAMTTAPDPERRDRLLLVLARVNDQAARQTVLDLLHKSRWNGHYPSGVALHVAGQMKLPEATGMAMEVLRAAARKEPGLLETQVLGALAVVTEANYPCRKVAYDLCRVLWYPDRPALLTRAAKLLGRQAARDEYQTDDAPRRAACVKMLQEAVQYSLAGEGKPRSTPLPSAAAAVALWELDPALREFSLLNENAKTSSRENILKILNIVESKTSLFFLREAAAVDDASAGDFIAWNLGRFGLPDVQQVGKAFLPAPGENRPEYSAAVRACGAMLLALSAGNDEQRHATVERIMQRLQREEYPASASLRCALLMTGRREQLADVRTLLEIEEFPATRALTALLVTGDKVTLDWLLWNTNWNLAVPLVDLPPLLIDQGMDDVLAGTVPALPQPSPAGSTATRLWQACILRHTYGIGRASLQVGWQR